MLEQKYFIRYKKNILLLQTLKKQVKEMNSQKIPKIPKLSLLTFADMLLLKEKKFVGMFYHLSWWKEIKR